MAHCNCGCNGKSEKPLEDWEYPDESESTYDKPGESEYDDDYGDDDSDDDSVVCCPNCGCELYDEDTICPKCGLAIEPAHADSVPLWMIILGTAALIALLFSMR